MGGSCPPKPPPGAGADVLPAPNTLESPEIVSWAALTGLTLVIANPKPMAAKVLTIFFCNVRHLIFPRVLEILFDG